MVDTIKRYICPKCEADHEHEDQARYCCPVEVEDFYICPSCGTKFDEEDDALSCCDDEGDGDEDDS